MDCKSLAVDLANAFDQIFNIDAVYGAWAFAIGCCFGMLAVVLIRGRSDD